MTALIERIHFPATSGQARVDVSCFQGNSDVTEYHIVATAPGIDGFASDLAAMAAGYAHALSTLGLGANSAVFRRIFLSDIANQAEDALLSPLSRPAGPPDPVALSLVGQAPVGPGRVVLWAYHIKDPEGLRKRAVPDGVLVERGAQRHLWLTGLAAAPEKGVDTVAQQTTVLLERFADALARLDATLRDHAVRTWFFVPNVDLDYGELVKARREVFARHGLTAETHYISSTGIEGRAADPRALAILDVYAIAGLAPSQVSFLHAPDHLGPTHLYGVTFERGTRVDFRDRRHLFLSGTASIDPAGHTLHLRDPRAQARRASENLDALLADGGCGPSDVMQLIVYLRDPHDEPAVVPLLRDRYPGVPAVVVRAPVCRPNWLVELECMAIRSQALTHLPPF